MEEEKTLFHAGLCDCIYWRGNQEDILELACLFGDSLESSTFSDIISTLESQSIQFKEHLLSYMIGLTRVRRFGAFVLFLSQADKTGENIFI